MKLPESVLQLINALEDRGFEAWAVGGCVRDHLLGIAPQDFDLCTSALPEQLQEVFGDRNLVLAGLKHGTVGVVTDTGVVEITTYRTEGAYRDSRHPGWVRFVRDVDEDLARRDFTVNAIAWSPTRGCRDPFGGRQDLAEKRLRCVGEPEARFREDALRILRGARFAARFGLRIETATWKAMTDCAPLLDALARERVFEELCKLICLADARLLCRLAPVLCRCVPELEPMVGFEQHNPHHCYDVFTHTAQVVEGVPAVLELRLAALLHDVGKPGCFTRDETGRGHFYGHAQRGAQMAGQILTALRAPTRLKEDVVWLIGHHMSFYPAERKAVRRALSRHGLQRLRWLVQLQQADLGGKGNPSSNREQGEMDRFRDLLEQVAQEEGELNLRSLAVKGADLLALGYAPGPRLGAQLDRLLEAVLSGEAPNEKETLLGLAARNAGGC